jgi:hypothetical protein
MGGTGSGRKKTPAPRTASERRQALQRCNSGTDLSPPRCQNCGEYDSGKNGHDRYN